MVVVVSLPPFSSPCLHHVGQNKKKEESEEGSRDGKGGISSSNFHLRLPSLCLEDALSGTMGTFVGNGNAFTGG